MPRVKSTKSSSRRKSSRPSLSALLRQVEVGDVIVPNPKEVLAYLARYRKLAALLREICREVRAQFPLPYEVALELYKDPEIDDRYLGLYVRQAPLNPDLLDHVEDFRERFYDRLHRVSGHLHITADFRKPRNASPGLSRDPRPRTDGEERATAFQGAS